MVPVGTKVETLPPNELGSKKALMAVTVWSVRS